MELNPQQQAAVNHVEGPLLVLAGAGSGKTRVVTHRIARLLDLGVLPSDILAVTFTNKAAEEMRARIRSMRGAQVLAVTFHSLGARILRESIGKLGYSSEFAIYDEDDSEKLLKSCLDSLELPDEKAALRKIRMEISNAKNGLLAPEEVQDEVLAKVYPLYQRRLQECQAVDFDDLLFLTVRLLQSDEAVRREYQNRWLFLLIDEYQDTNFAQYTLAQMLAGKHHNVFAVGDPDQSIYSWRGARYQNILNFERDFPGAKVIALEQNYRSTNTILEASNALIAQNEARYEKKLWSSLGEGDKIGVYLAPLEREEGEFVVSRMMHHRLPYNEVALLYRTNAQSRSFEDILLSQRIPYTIVGGLSFYERREIKDLIAFLRLILSNADLISFLRTVNVPKRGLGAATLERLVEASARSGTPIVTLCGQVPPDLKLSAKQREGLKDYLRVIEQLRNLRPHLAIHELLEKVVELSRYRQVLAEDPETEEDRKENIEELIRKAREWEGEVEGPTLPKFLEEITLRVPPDEDTGPRLQLMTLHNSKGLEFSLVFLVGMEEEIFPHINVMGNPEGLEEERRLCYVGMTRAKRFLYMTAAHYRFYRGSMKTMRPSRFLSEVPRRYLHFFAPHGSEPDATPVQPEGFQVGEWVSHAQFGEGQVTQVYQSSLGLTYDVRFEGTTRSLVAKFAKLRPSDRMLG